MNILAVGFCSYFQRVLFGVPTTPLQIDTLPKLSIPLLSKIPFIGEIFFQQNILTYMAYILIPVSIFVLYKTSLGLAIRSTGENPVAVDVAGLPVNRIRFLTVLVAGCIGGLAGSFYTVGYLGMFSSNIIGGRGWIAFAICFLGNWSPKGAVLGTLAFGLADALSIYFRTGNLWVTVFLHGAMAIASMLVGGLYGTEDVAESISGYDASMMLSILIYLIPTLFLLRKKKIGEVALYFGRDCAPAAAPAPEENGERLR